MVSPHLLPVTKLLPYRYSNKSNCYVTPHIYMGVTHNTSLHDNQDAPLISFAGLHPYETNPLVHNIDMFCTITIAKERDK